MMRTAALTTAALLATVLAAPLAAAHASTVVVELPNGERCYVFTSYPQYVTSEPEYWIETNGYLGDPSVPEALPYVLHVWHTYHLEHMLGPYPLQKGSGLQRSAGSWGAADTQVSADQWARACGPSA